MAESPSLFSLLVYDDIAAAYEYLVEVFRLAPGLIHGDENGRALHAEVRAGSVDIWLHRVTAEHHLASPKGTNDASSGLVVFVPDVDDHYQHVLSRGATVDGPPRDQPYGQRDYGVRDLENHRWWFATRL